MLDERLTLAFHLYEPCSLGADIGTDHAYLPTELLRAGVCERMILTDRSESALENARREVTRQRLMDRVSLRHGDGLTPVPEACGCISITGMGGRTIRDILLAGQDRLQDAVLILSAHTDLPLVRSAVSAVGYHLEREEPCFCGGRFYLVLRAVPGAAALTPRETRLGGPLFESASPLLRPYLQRRREVLQASLEGLRAASVPDGDLIRQAEEDLAFYQDYLKGE